MSTELPLSATDTSSAVDFNPLFTATGCIFVCDGKILLLKRSLSKSYPGRWGLPGGKVDQNETPLHSIIRELYEETHILVSAENLTLIKKYPIACDEFSFLYILYLYQAADLPHIHINKKEHTTLAWLTPDEALSLDLVPESDTCLYDALGLLSRPPIQLNLFGHQSDLVKRSTYALEQSAVHSPPFEKLRPLLSSPHNIFISLGPPAAGKTTIFNILSKRDPRLSLVADRTIMRRSSHLNYYLRKSFLDNDKSLLFHFQMESLLYRFRYTLMAPNNSLIDETIYTTLAYSKALYRLSWITDFEYEIFYNHYITYFSLLPQPAAIYYIDCPADIIMKRLRRRKRIHEQSYSIAYVEEMCFAFREVAAELSNKYCFNVVSIDTSKLKVEEIADRYAPVIS